MNLLRSLLSKNRLAGGAAILALLQFGASFAGLIRDRVLSSAFPPGSDTLDVVSVYIAAFRPSDLLIQTFILSGFVAVLTPLLASHLAHGRRDEMNNLTTSVVTIATGVFGLIALLLALFFRELAPLFTEFTGSRLELYILFGRLAAVSNLVLLIGAAFGQYEITHRWFWMYGLTPIVYTIGTISGALWLTPVFGPLGPMYGTLIGAVIYTTLRILDCSLRSNGFRLTIHPLWHPELLTMSALMLPPMIARAATQLELLLFDRVASGLPAGSVTINAFARNFQAAAVGIVGIAFAQSAYSLLSQAYAKGEMHRFLVYLKKGSLLTLVTSSASLFGLVAFCKVAAWLVHLTDPAVESIFIVVLAVYALSIPFESLNHLLLRACYSTKNTLVPAVLTMANGITAIAVAWFFASKIGVYAIPVGFVAGQVVQMIGIAVFLQRKIHLTS